MVGGRASQEAIVAGVTPLWVPGSVYELRVPNVGRRGTVSGYFDSVEQLAAAAARLDGAPGVYMTLNPVEPALLARAHNRVQDGKPKTTSDGDIPRRCWLFVDFDPERPSGTSSTDEQHDAALRRAGEAGRWLVAIGFPRASLVGADSGNGAHLLIRVDLPNDQETTELVAQGLEALSARYNDDVVSVDLTTKNPAHLMKVYGTRACKGDDLPLYPWRQSRLVKTPDGIEPAERAALETLAAFAPPKTHHHRQAQGPAFDLEGFIQRHLGDLALPPIPWNAGQLWRLRECLFDPNHVGGNPSLIQLSSGAIVYKCFKASCTHSWSDVREMYEPKPAAKPRERAQSEQARPPAERRQRKEKQPPRLHTLPSMLDVELEEIDWLWHPYIPFGKITLVEGDPGVKKSWLALSIASHLSRGVPLPGENQPRLEPSRTLLLAAEDGLGDTVKPRLIGMEADPRMIRPVLGLLKEDEERVLTLDAEGIDALAQEIESFKPRLVIIDPLIAYTGKADTNDASDVRALLMPLVQIAQREHLAMVALRHLSKAAGTSAAYKGQGNIQYFATARSVLAVARDRDNPARSILAPSKTSLAPDGHGIAFYVGSGRYGPSLQWDGPVDATADEILAPMEDPTERGALEEAKRWLHDFLFEGPKPVREVQHEARGAGHRERTLERAKTALGARAVKEPVPKGRWLWELPESSLAALALLAPFENGGATPGKTEERQERQERQTPWWSEDKEPF